MNRLILGALMAALLGACGAPEQPAPAPSPRLGQAQASLSTPATYDAARRAPRCASVGTGCDSGTLLRGRASLGPESNAPNTLGGTCADGTGGTYHSDESLDQLEVLTTDGSALAPGKMVQIRATVWAWGSGTSDKLDLYTTANADAPAWTFLTTLTPPAGGAQTLTATYTLPAGALQAVRGIFRYGGSAASCGSGGFTDNDDLVFAVQSGPSVRLTAPVAGAVLQNTTTLTAESLGTPAAARVSFYEGTRWLGDDTTAPYAYAWNTRAVANGTYSLTARAFDSAGVALATSGAVQVQVRNDFSAPTVRLTSPVEGAVLRGYVTLTATASDDVGVTRVEFYRDTTLLGTVLSTSSPSFSWNTRDAFNGTCALMARAYDAAGNATTSTAVYVTIDNDLVPPSVTLTSPTPGQLTPGTLTLAASASDDRGLTRLEFLLDGLVVCNQALTGELSVSRTCAVSMSTGTHTLHARAWDTGSNSRVTSAVSITVDATPPVVSLTSPAAGATVRGTVTVGVSVTDNQAVARTELFVDGTRVATRTSAPFDLSWDTQGVSNGSHSVRVSAYDTVGNLAQSAARSVTVSNDATPPTAVLLSPVSGQEIFSGLRIAARAEDAVGVVGLEFLVDGVAISGNSYASSPVVTVDFMWNAGALAQGYHTIVARATDAAGNVGVSQPVTFYMDKTPPTQVAITSLTNGQQVTGLVTVDAVASDDRGIRKVELLVDGWDLTSTTQAPYQLYWDTRMQEDGVHQVRVVAYDLGGNNTRSQTLDIVVNNGAPPVVALVSPTGGTVGGVVQVEATASADVGIAQVDFWLDTQLLGTVTAPPYAVTWDSQTTPNGSYQLRAVAVSTTGRTTPSEPVFLTVTNDAAPPTVYLSLRKQDGTDVTGDEVSGQLSIRGDAFDDSGISALELLLDGQVVVPMYQITGVLYYDWNTVSMPDGPHTLELRAQDTYGKVASVTRNLVVANDRTPPMVYIHAPSEGMSLSGTVTVVVPAYDDVGVTRIDLLVDGAPIMTTLSHHGDFPWDTRWHEPGTHTLTARAFDATGKVGESAPVTVTVLNDDVTGQAAYDATRQAPGCATVGSGCDSGVRLVGSGAAGFEPHAPNTLAGSCGDSAPAGFHTESAIDRVWVSSSYGQPMAAGEWVGVQLNVFTTSPLDLIDVYAAADAANPSWTRIATLPPYYSGPQQLQTSFQLPAGPLQAVRAVLRRGGTPASCAGGAVVDHDDLFFAVQ
jgi:hypothetical protein